MSKPIEIIAAATNSSAEEIDTDLLIAALTELQVLRACPSAVVPAAHTLLTVSRELTTQ